MANDLHEIIVSNIGTVYSGNNRVTARQKFEEYVSYSKGSQHGRAGGENVTRMYRGEIVEEHIGSLYVEEGAEPPTPTSLVEITVSQHSSRMKLVDQDGKAKYTEAPRYKACLSNRTTAWEVGDTRDEAVGALINSLQRELGIKIHYEE